MAWVQLNRLADGTFLVSLATRYSSSPLSSVSLLSSGLVRSSSRLQHTA